MDIGIVSRRERKKQENKENILRCARRLFEAKGFDNTSIEDVTEMADISKGTFFRYFSSKDSLIIGIAEEAAQEIDDYYNDELIHVVGSVKKIKLLYRRIFEDAIKYLHLTERVMFVITLTKTEYSSSINEIYYNLTKNLAIEAQKNKEISDEYSYDDIVILIRGTYYGVLFNCFQKDDISESVTELDTVMNILFKGIAGTDYTECHV